MTPTPDYRTELADLVRALQGQRCGYSQPTAAGYCLRKQCPVCHPEDYAPSLGAKPEPADLVLDPECSNFLRALVMVVPTDDYVLGLLGFGLALLERQRAEAEAAGTTLRAPGVPSVL